MHWSESLCGRGRRLLINSQCPSPLLEGFHPQIAFFILSVQHPRLVHASFTWTSILLSLLFFSIFLDLSEKTVWLPSIFCHHSSMGQPGLCIYMQDAHGRCSILSPPPTGRFPSQDCRDTVSKVQMTRRGQDRAPGFLWGQQDEASMGNFRKGECCHHN